VKKHGLWLGASIIALAWSGAAAAQGVATPPKTDNGASGVKEVVVTAERRTTNLQKTPIAASVLNQNDLLKNGVTTVDQLQFVTPSLTVNNFGQGNDIDIRGIGKGEHNTQTLTGVITYRDAVATFPGYIQEEPYYDISSVEVLRGPQGTFSGQNSTGGAIIVNTRDPVIGGGYNGYGFAHYGNYNDVGFQGGVNIPISSTFAARISTNLEYRDTFYNIKFDNLPAGVTSPGDQNVKWDSLRLSLLWEPIPNLKILSKTDYSYLQNGGYFGDAIINPLTGKPNGTGANINPTTGLPTDNLFTFSNNWPTHALDVMVRQILKIDYQLPDGITLRSVTGFQHGTSGWKGDIDGTDSQPAAFWEPNYMISEKVPVTIWSQEVNIISPDTGPFTWVVGGYYNHSNYYFPKNPVFQIGVPPGIFDEELYGNNFTHTAGGFGQVSFNLPSGFQLQVGGRYTAWSTRNVGLDFVPEYSPFLDQAMDKSFSGHNVTGKVALNWKVDPNNFLYAFVASGAKPGGLNISLYTYPQLPIPDPFGQEYVVDYEIGWKSSLFDNHVRTQIGGFYSDFRHFQVAIPIPNNPRFSMELNDPNSTKLYGFEASAQAVFGGLSINGNVGVQHSELGQFYAYDPRLSPRPLSCDLNTGPATTTCVNVKGHPQTYAPNVTYNIEAQYDFKLTDHDTLTPAITFGHVSGQWASIFDNAAQGDYLGPRNLLGASLAWTHGTFTVTGYGYNLTNQQYVSANLPPIRVAGAPRQYGVSVMKTF
jgi:iron complex outermembrane receptor protein